MKIAIVGAGAMGSIYAGMFAEAGHQVYAIDTWGDHVAAINSTGLCLEGPSGKRIISDIVACSSVAAAGDCELYVIATKASAVGDAARNIAAAMPGDALVLTIQNGLGAGERIAEFMPVDKVLLGVADGFGAAMKAPGHAQHNAMKLIRLGEMNGGITDRLLQLESLWREAGFTVQAFDDIHQLIWEKFICNVALSGPSALFDCTIGELLENAESRAVSIGCMMEAYNSGLAEGINFSFDDPLAYLEKFVAMMPAASPSLRQDFQAKRPSEIDAINGRVPVVGKRHNIPAPYNETISALVRAHEARY